MNVLLTLELVLIFVAVTKGSLWDPEKYFKNSNGTEQEDTTSAPPKRCTSKCECWAIPCDNGGVCAERVVPGCGVQCYCKCKAGNNGHNCENEQSKSIIIDALKGKTK